MALVVKEYVPKLKFQYQNFEIMDIPGLIINIWSYSHDHGQYCNICCTYKNWCIKALKKMVKTIYFVVRKLCQRDEKWCNISRISPADSMYL